jgi:3D (Asp-Asp-Asp) domain-containing protein
MGIVNIIATASIAVTNFVQPIGQIGIMNTNTNTKEEISKEFAQEAQVQEEIKKEEPIKTEEEIKNDKILDKWKAKQGDKWESLPTEKFTINASAYTAAADECGKSNGVTSSGIKVEEKRTLACPPEYPFGAIIEIEGMGQFRCEDRGGAIKGNHFDIYMETKAEAFKFGRRNLVAWVVK